MKWKVIISIMIGLLSINICSCQKEEKSIIFYAGPMNEDLGEKLIYEGRYQEALDYYFENFAGAFS